MKRTSFAARLAEELDGKSPGGCKHRSPEYDEILSLARLLTTTDFSTDCHGRATIRERLGQAAAGETRYRGNPRPSFFTRLRIAAVFTGCIIGALLLFSILCPRLTQAAVERIRAAVTYLRLGPHTDVKVIEVKDRAEIQEYLAKIPPDRRRILDAAHNVAESVCTYGLTRASLRSILRRSSDPAEASIVRYATLRQAQAAFPYRLRRPTHLPAGYRLLEVRTFTLIESLAFLRYDGPGGVIEFTQMCHPGDRQGHNWVLAPWHPFSEVRFAGGTAAWVEDGQGEVGLIWENPEITFTLAGKGLTLAETVAIAESVK